MKQGIVILLLSALLLQLFTNAVILVNYVINKEDISKNLCENRDKPQMHCNGKCHLMKQLKRGNKKQEQSPLALLKCNVQAQYFEEKQEYTFSNPEFHISIHFPRYLIGSTSVAPQSVFHPPTV